MMIYDINERETDPKRVNKEYNGPVQSDNEPINVTVRPSPFLTGLPLQRLLSYGLIIPLSTLKCLSV